MRSLKPLLICAALTLAAWSSNAAAAVITYTLSGIADGDYQDSAGTTPFSNVSISINGTGDPSTIASFGEGAYVYLTSAWLVADGVSKPIAMAQGALFVIGTDDPYKGIAFFGDTVDGTLNSRFFFASPSLLGYSGASNFGPAPVTLLQLSPIALIDGTTVNFSQINRAAFAASVPEPAGWAMMLLGMFALGAVVRRVPAGSRHGRAVRGLSRSPAGGRSRR